APTLGDGGHTFQVVVTDAAGNSSSASRSFTVDGTGPVVVFDDVPPAVWPVDYYNVTFHTTETATFECSVTGGAFVPCSSPFAVTTAYGATQNLRVRATDTLGNTGAPAQTNWTPNTGLVLHYPWEQGRTHNTSLLAQRPAYSPDGPAAARPFVGGWAGTALGTPNGVGAHTYAGTAPALSSSATPGTYTVSFWMRGNSDGGDGTLLSTLGTTGGFRVSTRGNSLTVEVREGAQLYTDTVSIPMSRWASIALVATGPGKGLQIVVDGMGAGIVDVPTATGFDAGQASGLTVGPLNGNVDLDDLRFYNRSITGNEACTVLARGFFGPQGTCIPGSPGVELDFERGVIHTGMWFLQLVEPRAATFLSTATGTAMRLQEQAVWGVVGFKAFAASGLSHSLSLWFHENGSFTPLVDMVGECVVRGPVECGLRVTYADNGVITVYAGTDTGVRQTRSFPVARDRPNSVVITEQKSDPRRTDNLTVYINGVKVGDIPIGDGDVFEDVANGVPFNQAVGSVVDEIEFWQSDLSQSDEALCENGFDGEFDPLTGGCALTAN
ncbi:MAG: LamG-like jellyroll fold domain-containing protein, partial [Kofleriaceae bacterium]